MSKEEYISQYTYLGKTIKEWEQDAKNTNGLDKDGNPSWWESQANATYGMAFAELFYEKPKKDEDE